MTISALRPTRSHTSWSSMDNTLRTLAKGELVILRHEDRFVLVGCAGTVTTEQMAFMVRHGTGFVQVALHERDCDRLGIPEAIPNVRTPSSPAYGQCVAVDAAAGITTGISGADRARTARVLADPRSDADDLRRPGHLVPVRVEPQVLCHRRTAAASALALTDTVRPDYSGAVFTELDSIDDPFRTADVDDAEAFARLHGLALTGSARPFERLY